MMGFEKCFLVMLVTTIAFNGCSCAYHHMVGESIWSIPLSQDFYKNWSSRHTFRVGDSLVFDFESGFYNVMQVSRREYEDCTANSPFRAFGEGPATVPLHEEGVHYFLCSLGNYCHLGQKLLVVVQHSPFPGPPPPLQQPSLSTGPNAWMWASRPATVSSSPSTNPSVRPVQVGHMAPVPSPRGPSQFHLTPYSGDADFKCGGLSIMMVFVAFTGALFGPI
ncbi:hypothetical protein AAC387_Pa01g2761 [Persea americana]